MLILLSPAKTLDFTSDERGLPGTKPELHSDARQLAAVAKGLSAGQVAKLMGISENLAATAHGYFQNWKQKWDAKQAKQAALAFRGDVYQGLDADSLSDADLEFAQDHLRVLSGLYGLLRPLDLMQPYRLEMGTKLKNPRGKNLYEFWHDRLTRAINAAAHQAACAATGSEPLVVNLASNEYFKAVVPAELAARVVAPAFKDLKNGQYKSLMLFAKRARGMMARYLVQKRATDLATLRKFRAAGYRYNRQLSTDDAPIFTRDQSADT